MFKADSLIANVRTWLPLENNMEQEKARVKQYGTGTSPAKIAWEFQESFYAKLENLQVGKSG